MKSLFKVTLLATTMAVALNAPLSFAADTAAKPAATTDSKAAFKNDDQKSAYALGASLGRYMENSLKEQEKLGIKLDKNQLIAASGRACDRGSTCPTAPAPECTAGWCTPASLPHGCGSRSAGR